MPTLSISTTYADGSPLTKALLDEIKTGIESFLNTTKIDSDNIQTGGVATANLATGCVTAAKLASSAVETAKINDSAVTTAKINANAVTRAKLESVGQQASSSSGSFSMSSSTYADVTNLSVSITVTGRPVMLMLCASDATAAAYLAVSVNNGTTAIGYMQFLRGSTEVGHYQFGLSSPTSGQHFSYHPLGGFCAIDTGASAGTYTYKVQIRRDANSNSAYAQNVKLVAYEL